jgi:hypothetical protein
MLIQCLRVDDRNLRSEFEFSFQRTSLSAGLKPNEMGRDVARTVRDRA